MDNKIYENNIFIGTYETSINNKLLKKMLIDDKFAIATLKEIAKQYDEHTKYILQTLPITDDRYQKLKHSLPPNKRDKFCNFSGLFTLKEWETCKSDNEVTQQKLDNILNVEYDDDIIIYPATSEYYYACIILDTSSTFGDIKNLPKEIKNKITHVYVEKFGT